MTLIYCIAANHELPIGSFGQKKTIKKLKDVMKLWQYPPQEDPNSLHEIIDEEYIEVYETEDDFAGLYVGGPSSRRIKYPHFRLPLVYHVHPEGGSFDLSPKLYKDSPDSYRYTHKCVKELFSYLDRNLERGGEIELYAGWDDGRGSFDEPSNTSLDLVLDLSTFELGEEFLWQERQYILVKKS